MRTALGVRAHSGWAALVAVAGTVERPHVLERRRIITADGERAGSKQPYHAAAGLPARQAERLVREARESSLGLAVEAMRGAIADLAARGHEVTACAVALGSGRPLPELARVLASHALIHTAEGEMFREVLMCAARECGLKVMGEKEKALDRMQLERLDSLGKLIGPPWTQDQKIAAAVAFLALL